MSTSKVPFALVVDDDAIIRMDACDILEDAGFRTLEAVTADDGQKVLASDGDSIVLLFTDVEMPGKHNGFALARYAAKHWPEIVIVVASGQVKPQPGDMPESASFMGKPFSAATVHEHLRRTLPDGKKPEPLRSPV